jgi:phage terminase large subunit-like protein
MKRYHQYVDDVESGRVIACDATKKAVARFVSDLEASKKRGALWHFDENQADRVIRFVEKLKQFEEPFTGLPIVLEPWQCFFIGQLYGWRDRHGRRRFKKALLFMGRKQGKTILASALALYEIREKPGIEAYSLATKQLIANKAFKNIRVFIQKNDALLDHFTIRKSPQSIYCQANESTFTPLSSDSDLDGLNPAYVIVDELAAQANGVAYNVLTSGMGTRSEPLTVIISTAAASLENPLIEEYEYAKKILAGSVVDDSFLAAIYELDQGDKWDDLSVMQKSCPNLGVSVQLDYFEKELRRAKVIPIAALEYKVKYCNLWQASTETWIPDALWTRCRMSARKHAAETTPEKLAAAPCIIGMDFSTIWDWTAVSRYYWLADLGRYAARHRFYIPGDLIDQKAHMETPALRKWIADGLVTATPGESIDQGQVFRDLEADLARYRVLAITYDPAKAKEFEAAFGERVTIVPFPQKTAFMSPAAKAWEKAIVDGHIMDDNPVIRWMLSNTVNKVNPDTGSYFITKSPIAKARKRIDGVVSSLMAYSVMSSQLAELAKPKPKVFDLSNIRY